MCLAMWMCACVCMYVSVCSRWPALSACLFQVDSVPVRTLAPPPAAPPCDPQRRAVIGRSSPCCQTCDRRCGSPAPGDWLTGGGRWPWGDKIDKGHLEFLHQRPLIIWVPSAELWSILSICPAILVPSNHYKWCHLTKANFIRYLASRSMGSSGGYIDRTTSSTLQTHTGWWEVMKDVARSDHLRVTW